MQMACEYNPPFYLFDNSRFDPYVFTANQLDESIHRLELIKIMEDTCDAVIVSCGHAYFPTDLFRTPGEMIRPDGERTFILEHRNGRSLIVE
jgi:hypothetical protein